MNPEQALQRIEELPDSVEKAVFIFRLPERIIRYGNVRAVLTQILRTSKNELICFAISRAMARAIRRSR